MVVEKGEDERVGPKAQDEFKPLHGVAGGWGRVQEIQIVLLIKAICKGKHDLQPLACFASACGGWAKGFG